MSSPLSSLSRLKRRSSSQSPVHPLIGHMGTERQKTILRSNSKEENAEKVSWAPPDVWMTDIAGFTTTSDNFGWRKARAVNALRYLLKETGELIEQPSQYLFDIWWFRYLSSSKHMMLENPLATQAEFVRLGLPKLFKQLWSEHLCITDVSRWGKVNKDSVEALYHITMALWFISSNPTHQNQMFDELGDFIITTVCGPAFEYNIPKIKRMQDCLKSLLGMIYQFAKKLDHARSVIREKNAIETLQRIAAKSRFNKNVKGRAYMILAFILNEDEQKGVNVSEGVIAFLIYLLKDCLDTDTHRSTTHNYEALEILEGLNRLAISDGNKLNINDNDGLPLYLELLRSTSLAEQEEACRGLWTLCFHPLVAANVSADTAMMSALQSFAKSKYEALKCAACGCLWTVQKLRDSRQSLVAARLSGHVMISYSWSVQTAAKEVKDTLQDNGYRVWMDIENMSGSTLTSMSQAIERATVVIILLSDQYKTSPACRAEAEYAYKLEREIIPLKVQSGYSPDGWLGMLIGMKMSFDFTESSEKDATYQQLIAALGDKGKGPPISDTREPVEPDVPDGQLPTDETKPTSPLPKQNIAYQAMLNPYADLQCASWNSSSVSSWIDKNKLQELTPGLGDMTGQILAELRYMLLRETEHYYRLLRSDLSLSSLTVLRLSAALRKLA
ncbi:uncharacterized protein [Watersipora subatra]|uniref:uncharacterized protein n=1 Tax=Watersipora subatra TaxID=2589382 RepID=UPI00355C729A